MNSVNVGIGVVAIALGLSSGVLRVVRPGMLRKLEPMQRSYGVAAGNVIHFLSYVVAPMAFGITMLIAGLK